MITDGMRLFPPEILNGYQRSNCQHLLDHGKSKRVPEKTYFCFIDYAKAFDCVDHKKKLWKTPQEIGIPDHLTCLLRNLYAGQEATELDMEQQTGSKSGNEYVKAVYYHLTYLTLCRVHHANGRLDEAQVGIKIARRNINNLRYAYITTLMAKSEE